MTLGLFKEPKPYPGQDPWVVTFEGSLLLLQSADNNRKIVIRRFADLAHIRDFDQTVVWAPRGTDHDRQLWAPELHHIDGRWYIYYAASDGRIRNHRMYVLEAEHPLGPYREIGKVFDPRHDTWAIDLTVFRHGGELYAVWSGWEESTDGSFQNLYIAPMSSPSKISGERQQISRPEHGWEMSGGAVNEGPHVVRNENAEKVFIVYAADASWTSAYKMGLLEWTGGDVMDPASWSKLPWPIFTGGGHGCFLDTPDGHWFVYHRKLTADPGWADREIRFEPYSWDDDGYPVIGDIEEMHAKAKRPKARRDAPRGFPTAADATAKVPFRPQGEPRNRVGGPAGEGVVVD